MAQIELACKEAVFHFNKKHLTDPEIPMWVVKAQGETYYVNHVNCSVPWSTKETPNNSHTKGSIKIKRCLITIDDDNVASIDPLTLPDIARFKKRNAVRFITSYADRLTKMIENLNLKHGPIKYVSGGCGTSFLIVDIMDKGQATMLTLSWDGPKDSLRILKENEAYYKLYDAAKSDYIPEIDDEDYQELYEN